MSNLLPAVAVVAGATTLAAGLIGGFATIAAAAPLAQDTGGLVVNPASELFDVALETGVPEMREVTISNTSDAGMDVQLSVVLSDGASPEHRMEHLMLHATSDFTSCDASIMAAAEPLRFSEVQRVDQESVDAGGSRTICIGVVLPADTPPMDAATTVVDLQFHTIGNGQGGGGGAPLPSTGVDLWRFLPAGLFAVLTGGLLALIARRHRTDGRQICSQQGGSEVVR